MHKKVEDLRDNLLIILTVTNGFVSHSSFPLISFKNWRETLVLKQKYASLEGVIFFFYTKLSFTALLEDNIGQTVCNQLADLRI